MKSWRSGPDRVLIPRPIKEREWPRLVNAMNEDGLACFITPRGLVWMVGRASYSCFCRAEVSGACLKVRCVGSATTFTNTTLGGGGMTEWTGRWCSGCGHQWDITDPNTKPCDCPKGEDEA